MEPESTGGGGLMGFLSTRASATSRALMSANIMGAVQAPPQAKTALDLLHQFCSESTRLGEDDNGVTSEGAPHLVAVLTHMIVLMPEKSESVLAALEPFIWASTLHRTVVCRHGAVPPLVAMVRANDNPSLRSAALRLLSQLADGDTERSLALEREEFIGTLLKLLQDSEGLNPEVAFFCGHILTALAASDEGREENRRHQICKGGGIAIAFECLRSADRRLAADMAHLVQSLFPLGSGYHATCHTTGQGLTTHEVSAEERQRLRRLVEALKAAGPLPVPQPENPIGVELLAHLQNVAVTMMEAAAHEGTDEAMLEGACTLGLAAQLKDASSQAERALAKFRERAEASKTLRVGTARR